MAEIKNQEETTFPIKRKSDTYSRDTEDFPMKSQKGETLYRSNLSADDEDGKSKECEAMPKENNTSLVPNEISCSPSEDNYQYHHNGDEDDEGLNGKSEVDRKGKGIMLGDKGKGKISVEDEDEDEEEDDSDDDDDDSSDDGEVSIDDSDLSDDPLTEVNLDNILPSRTRRRTLNPSVCISNDLANDVDK